MANENKFLDYSGVTKLWSKIKSYVAGYFSAGDGIKLDGSTFKHTNSVTAVTADGVASSNNVTPSYGNTFNVPHFTYDAQGHITSAGTHTVKIPANADTKVTQNSDTSTNGDIPVLLAYQASPVTGTAQTAKYSNLKYNPSTSTLDSNKINATDITASTASITGSVTTDDINVTGRVMTSKIKGTDILEDGDDAGGRLELFSDNNKATKSGGISIDNQRIHLSFFNSSLTGGYGGYGTDQFNAPSHELELKNDGTFKWDGNSVLTSVDLTWDKLTGKPTSFTPSNHTHGKISNDGKVTEAVTVAANATAASADYLLISDASDGGRVVKGVQFNNGGGFLKANGTWATPTNTVTTIASTTGTGNAITDITASNGALTLTKGETFLTAHPSITKSTNTTSTATPGYGGTFTCIDGITQDANGHITLVNTKTVTIPSSDNTDAKTSSTATTSGKLFIIGASSQSSSGQTTKSYVNCYIDGNKLYSNGKEVITDLSNYYNKSEIDTKLTAAMHYKGSVDYLQIPSTGAVSGKTYLKKANGTNNIENVAVGDFYNVKETGANYAWTGTEWDQTGFMVEFERLTDSEIDAACAAAS